MTMGKLLRQCMVLSITFFIMIGLMVRLTSSTESESFRWRNSFKREAQDHVKTIVHEPTKPKADNSIINTEKNTNTSSTKSVIPTSDSVTCDPTNASSDSESKKCTPQGNKNATKTDDGFMNDVFGKLSDNRAMLYRTVLVFLGVTSIVIVYFVVRAVRLRRRRSKSRKYGVITRGNGTGDMEMEPLGDGNDDEEDYTVFEMNGRRK